MKSVEVVVNQVQFEIGQINHLFDVYADLISHAQNKHPDDVEIAAISSVLHAFYNGLENIFTSVAKIDGDVPVGPESHRELLKQMLLPGISRPPLLSQETANRLVNYLGFRHFYRHSYTFILEWGKVEELVTHLVDVWDQVRGEISAFCLVMKQAP